MEPRDIGLILIGAVLTACVAAFLVRRKLHREFPFFFVYLVVSVLVALVRLAVSGNYPLYFKVFWATEALYALLALLALYEVFHEVFLPFYELWWWFRLVFPGTVGIAAFVLIDYLRAVDLEEVGQLLDPVAEEYLRLNLAKEQFRIEQRHRMWLALEYIGRLSHNGLIMAEWGHYELKRNRRTRIAEDRKTCLELVSASVQVKMCTFVLRSTIRLWLVRMAVLPFLAPPSFEKLIDAGSTDLLEFYETMTGAAVQLSQAYGDLYCQKMAQALQPFALS